jgi:hypothetical protein
MSRPLGRLLRYSAAELARSGASERDDIIELTPGRRFVLGGLGPGPDFQLFGGVPQHGVDVVVQAVVVGP